jgi:hypothetical protein
MAFLSEIGHAILSSLAAFASYVKKTLPAKVSRPNEDKAIY